MTAKKKRRRAPGAGRKAQGYERMTIHFPPGTRAAIDARRAPGETPGECVARLLESLPPAA